MTSVESAIGLASNALVTEGIVERRREGNRIVLNAPTRRDFWFGHGFVLDAPPTRAALDAMIAEGRVLYAGTGAQRFVVMWERARETHEPFGIWPRGVEEDRAVVQVYAGPCVRPDPRVVDVQGDDMWRAVTSLAVAEYPEFSAQIARRFEDFRAAVQAGRARSVAILGERGEPACTVTLYRGERLARFASPVTRVDMRGSGFFSACAQTLVAWARDDAPRAVVIIANQGSYPVGLYEKLGFRAVAFDESAVVTL